MSNLNYEKLGIKIREYRLKNKLTQEKLAEIVNLSPRYIAFIENGYKVPKLETFINILNALNASADYVLEDSINYKSKEKIYLIEDKLKTLPSKYQKEILDILDCIIENYKK